MASDESDIYFFTRNASETERLSKLHQILTENAGFTLHPLTLTSLPNPARIADIATGSGTWALSAASALPASTRIHCYDNSAAQFPATHPANVSFEVADAKLPFPEALHDSFDVVHVRTLVAAMNPGDWEGVVANLVRILKPGGWLHWSEADSGRVRCLRGSAEYRPYGAMRKLLGIWDKTMGPRMAEGFGRLEAAIYAHGGLRSVEVDAISTDRLPEYRGTMTQIYVGAILGGIEKAGMMSGEALEGLRRGVEGDIRDGAYMRADGIHFVAQKA